MYSGRGLSPSPSSLRASQAASVGVPRLGQLQPPLLYFAFIDSDPVFSLLSSFQISKIQIFFLLSAKFTIVIGSSAPARQWRSPVLSACCISEALLCLPPKNRGLLTHCFSQY